MGPDGPQYTMGGKVVEMYREGAPGPGQYELRVESGPGVKIGKTYAQAPLALASMKCANHVKDHSG